MKTLKKILEKLSFPVVILGCVTLGLAPFNPPHVYEKLLMLFKGQLSQAIDWFDLFLHGSPWLILILKIVLRFYRPKRFRKDPTD